MDRDPAAEPSLRDKPFRPSFRQHIQASQETKPTNFTRSAAAPALPTTRALCNARHSLGLLWGKQSYHYEVQRWLDGDSTQPKPDPARCLGRNHDWTTLYNSDVISMPDKWEYPWYAAWDLAFHCVAMALIDPDFAKRSADSFPARMVYASERRTSRL